MGKTLGELSDQVVIELEFYDYTMRPIIPNVNVVAISGSAEQYTITETETTHVLGVRGGNNFRTFWVNESNKMKVTMPDTTEANEITSIRYFAMKEFNTSEKSYTKFRYIQ